MALNKMSSKTWETVFSWIWTQQHNLLLPPLSLFTLCIEPYIKWADWLSNLDGISPCTLWTRMTFNLGTLTWVLQKWRYNIPPFHSFPQPEETDLCPWSFLQKCGSEKYVLWPTVVSGQTAASKERLYERNASHYKSIG